MSTEAEKWLHIPAHLSTFDLWTEEDWTGIAPERIERITPPVQTMSQSEAAFADRRKLAIGRAIVARGPLSAGEIGRICYAEGVPVDCADRYVRTLTNRNSGFLVTLYLKTVVWDLTPKGRAWVAARENGGGV